MTAQIHDSVRFAGEAYALVGCSDGEPFLPADVGYRPVMASTACWRGYVCGYEVKDGWLHLRDLSLSHRPDNPPSHSPEGAPHLRQQQQQPPDLHGVAAVWEDMSLMGNWCFCDVSLPLSYTGGLVIGRNFIRALDEHMGFEPAWKYRLVHELLFEQGRLVQSRDVSLEMERLRMGAASR